MATIVDSYSESNGENAFSVDSEESYAYGQSFTGDGGILNSAKFYLGKYGGPTGSCYAKVYSHSGTYGTTSVPDTLLATSDAVDVSTLADYTTPALATFTFSGANKITLTSATKYVVVFEYNGGSGSAYVQYWIDFSSLSHDGNGCQYWSSTWYYDASFDTCFYVYKDDATSTSTTTTTIPIPFSVEKVT